jgi:phage terminase large subunit-like protein
MSRPTRSGTKRLSEVARHVIVPAGIVSTGYPAVQQKCRDLGIEHDVWQQGMCRLALGKRKDGKYAATIGGVVLSIPRQVGKTFTVGSVIFALCILFPGMKVLWTAHRSRTANETFRSMQGMTRRKKIAPHIAYVRSANGEQEIGFQNGSRILFGAREQGFGRGFAEVDIEVFDEAQILTERALEDMVAATNQARHPAGALLFYMGTPPRAIDPGDAFRNKRAKALNGKSKDTVYVELSADPNADPDDHAQWAKANPSYPKRTPLESMQRLRENVGSDESFLREGLGVWSDSGGAVIDPAQWAALADVESEIVSTTAFAVEVTGDRTWAAIASAGRRLDGDLHVELIDHRPGTGWVVDRLVELRNSWAPCAIAVDPSGASGSLMPALEAAGVQVALIGTRDMAAACGGFYDAAVQGTVRHLDQPPLNAAVTGAKKRPIGDAWAWDRKKSTDDISALVAVTLARYAFTVHGQVDLSESVW